MPFRDSYERQVRLLLRTIPLVAEEECFALKGGTAINLFLRDMPRLSVDIDLTYLPVAPRHASLAGINAALLRIANRVQQTLGDVSITGTGSTPEKSVVKLLVRQRDAQIKIEVSPVLRGSVFAPARRSVSPAVEEAYGFAEIQVVSFEDLYAGKLVAALDRQHPRDLFDVRDLLRSEGISDALRRAFVVYLISHNRPMAEILDPSRKPLREEFARGFDGMTAAPVAIDELEETRESMIAAIVGDMPDEHRRFLMSFERGEPEWQLLSLPQAQHLPAVQWRRKNLATLSEHTRAGLVQSLKSVLHKPGRRPAAGA